MATTKSLLIDGKPYRVLDALSTGPNDRPHTYELPGGAFVYTVTGGAWYLQERGQFRREVRVELRCLRTFNHDGPCSRSLDAGSVIGSCRKAVQS